MRLFLYQLLIALALMQRGETAAVTCISWIGVLSGTQTVANNPVASESRAFGNVTATFYWNGTLASQPVSIYSYTADLVSPMLIQGGQTMWLSIFQQHSSLQPLFGWFSGSGGDGVSKQFLFSDGSLVNTYTDRALTLEGNEVPEPGSVALMGLGGVLLVVLRRRR